MGRGLSDQQRRILALAVADNAARRAGAPRPQVLVLDRRAGYLSGDKYRLALRVAFAPEFPDLTEQFVLAALYGFKVSRAGRDHAGWMEHWQPRSVRRGKQVSVRRALRSLVARGYLVDAWPAKWMQGLGFDAAECSRLDAMGGGTCTDDCGFNAFWFSGLHIGAARLARAYWLLPPAFEEVSERWRDVDSDGLLETFWWASRVREDRGGEPQWWQPLVPEPVVVDAEPMEVA